MGRKQAQALDGIEELRKATAWAGEHRESTWDWATAEGIVEIYRLVRSQREGHDGTVLGLLMCPDCGGDTVDDNGDGCYECEGSGDSDSPAAERVRLLLQANKSPWKRHPMEDIFDALRLDK